jgi:hypothetical protein
MPTFSRFFRWRNIRRTLVCCAALATLIALFYAEENWRGKHAWERYKKEAGSKRGILDWQSFIPPKVPDDQNFAMTPFLAPLFDFNPEPRTEGQSRWRDTNGYNRASQFVHELSEIKLVSDRSLMNLEQAAVRLQSPSIAPGRSFSNRIEVATALLKMLKASEPVLDEIRLASHRPFARFNVSYNDENPAGILLPHLAVVKQLSLIFALHASAELVLGKTDEAYGDVEMIFYLAECLNGEPFVISQLVRVDIIRNFARQMIWEGLVGHQWKEDQLQGLQSRLQKLAFINDLDRSLHAERDGFGDRIFQYVRNHPSEVWRMVDDTSGNFGVFTMFSWLPKGWLYQEKVVYYRLFDGFFESFDPAQGRVEPRVIEQRKQEIDRQFQGGSFSFLWNHRLLSKLLLPTFAGLTEKFAHAETDVELADLACALERYRITKGTLPDSLSALAPQFIPAIPHDVINGELMKYQRLDDGRFKLYSVGWNEKDDGGTEVIAKGKTRQIDPRQGDWVWPQYPVQ